MNWDKDIKYNETDRIEEIKEISKSFQTGNNLVQTEWKVTGKEYQVLTFRILVILSRVDKSINCPYERKDRFHENFLRVSVWIKSVDISTWTSCCQKHRNVTDQLLIEQNSQKWVWVSVESIIRKHLILSPKSWILKCPHNCWLH